LSYLTCRIRNSDPIWRPCDVPGAQELEKSESQLKEVERQKAGLTDQVRRHRAYWFQAAAQWLASCAVREALGGRASMLREAYLAQPGCGARRV
jgi:hypothetical protein